ncbi:hypothetical protein [Amycolatopsis sp. NPDC051061]|uniref:hypothetical protein n=1 Tax=Amycolatopsis sp. NPDC051061 TaxID=3155042 RepID=UPI00342C301C
MTFSEDNHPWLAAMQEPGPRQVLLEANPHMRGFADALGAHRFRLLPHPFTIAADDHARLADAARVLVRAQTTILRHLLATLTRENLHAMFGLPASAVIDWAELAAEERIIARLDVLPTTEGYRFCEMNIDSSISGFEIHDCVDVLCARLGWSLLEGTASPQRDIAALIGRIARDRASERVVICDWDSRVGIGYFGFDLLRGHIVDAVPELDVQLVHHGDYRAEWLREGDRTLVYRGFMHADVDDPAFVERLVGSGATVVNLFDSEIRTHKAWFAMFWDERYRRLLDPATLETIGTFVPRTVRMTPGNQADLIARREELVFKLARSSGGRNVVVGREHTAAEITARLRGTGPLDWVAQRFVETSKVVLARDIGSEPRPHHVVLGIYLVDGAASGLLLRASETSTVVNVSGTAAAGWVVPATAAARQRHLDELRALGAATPVGGRR